ncbi:MAG: glucose-1-phosphate adenylyltransferase subunit GlgD, partial [Clostridia bacterium]|nr:glucose-1-phosphate adenylyltransferase subunit GlgD [Clostridia bacterium]
RVTDIEYNPYKPSSDCQACDVFVMEKTLLEYLIEEAAAHDAMDFIRDVVMKNANSLKVYGWGYKGYVARMNSLSSYFTHNMAMLKKEVRDDLFCTEHPIYTKVKDEVPAVYTKSANVKNSLIADGCRIEGEVENSILFRGVTVGEGTKLNGCIVMQACHIEAGCDLDHVIMDKGVTIRRGRRLAGYDSFPVIIRKNSII